MHNQDSPGQAIRKILRLPCRYYRVFTDEDVPCLERNFHYVYRELPIPVDQAALVLVDVWSTHYVESWVRRAREITQTKIVPVLQAARKIGMTVIHAPGPYIVERRYKDAPRPAQLSCPSNTPDWPPSAFRDLYRYGGGEYAAFGRNREPRLQAAYEHYETELDIAEEARPLPNELIIYTGQQMHEILAEREILHLIYVGYATNWCILGRDYGVIAMSRMGYNIILVRDATAGLEFHDTYETMAATEMAIRDIEVKSGWTTTTESFLEACTR